MSKLLISRNIFLEKEELNRLIKFLGEDSVKALIGNAIGTAGIVPTSGVELANNFRIAQGSDFRHIKIMETSTAYDFEGNRIHYEYQPSIDIRVPSVAGTTTGTWVSVEYGQTSLERGTVSLASNGQLTGIDTLFTEVLRGITSLVPNKIRIYKRVKVSAGGTGYSYENKGTYEVTQVINDTSILINTTTPLPSEDYVYSVVGGFSPGTYNEDREEEIYKYDSYNLIFHNSDPTDILTENQFILAKVSVNENTSSQTINNLRKDVFSFLSPDIINNISYLFVSLKGSRDSLIISGCESVLSYSGTTKISLLTPAGYVLLGSTIYPVDSHTTTIPDPSFLPYWVVYNDGGVNKAQCVYSATKNSEYFDYDQNNRTVDRTYEALFQGLSPITQTGIYTNRITLVETGGTGKYALKLDGSNILQSSVSNPPDKTIHYRIITNSRTQSRVIRATIVGVTSASLLGISVSDESGVPIDILASGYWDLSMKKISREEY